MPARAAAIVPDALVDVFEHVPEYHDYGRPETVKICESEYRISLGRVIKAWGDQLLDVAENAETPLSHHELASLDSILAGITELFDQLNRFRPTQVEDGESARLERLRRADALIIALLEESDRNFRPLRRGQRTHHWLTEEAETVVRSLQALVIGLERRNEVLFASNLRPGTEDPRRGGRA